MSGDRPSKFRSRYPGTVSAGAPPAHTHAGTDITSALIAQARLGTGSTGAGTKVLYDDQTFKTPSGGGGGSGDVVGPASAVNLDVAVFDGTTGKLIKDGGTLLSALATTSAVAAGYQPLDSDLTTVAGLTPTTGNVIQSVGSAWASRTMAQFKVTLAMVVADISDFVSAVASAITTERTAVATLTNKTLTAPVIATISNTGTLTLPTSTDTLVGRATTDTLTNKTLTSPTMTAPVLGTPASGTLTNCTFPTLNQNTTGSAAKWTTARTLAITGDLAYTSPSLDGTSNVTAAGTLATTGVGAGSYGTASAVGAFTVDAKGRLTGASAPAIAIAGTQITSGTVPEARIGTNTPTTGKFLRGQGTGSAAWDAITFGDVATGTVAIANGGTGATTATTARASLGIRPAGWKFNLLATSGATTDPGAGNARFFTGGTVLYMNYTDADSKDRSGYFPVAFAFPDQTAVVDNGTSATEIGIGNGSDNTTWCEFGFGTPIDPAVFTTGQPIYVVVTPAP